MDSNALHLEGQANAALAHHFDSPRQQFEAAKLGMWLFLATEVLLFGGLFCLYAVFRGNHPELFAYGSRFLDTPWGAINTAVLILSSFTMATAVYCAQTNQRRALVAFLAMTLFLGLDFLGIKYIEYSHKFHDNLVWGIGFYEMPEHEALKQRLAHAEDRPTAPTLEPGEAQAGKPLYLQGCLGCHGARGQGLPGLGKALQTSQFVADSSDTALLKFLRTGRPINDPVNTSGMAMPPRGGNPRLSDQRLLHIIAFVRTLQEQADEATSSLDDSAQEFMIPHISEAEIREISFERVTTEEPIEVSARSLGFVPDIRRGRELYLQSCASCHGTGGRGDGLDMPLDEQGRPISVRDLVSESIRGGDDPVELFKRIRCGIPGTPMPTQELLDDEDIWQLVYYTRHLMGRPLTSRID